MYMKQDELNVNMESVRPELANYSHILYITIERLNEFIAASPIAVLYKLPSSGETRPASKWTHLKEYSKQFTSQLLLNKSMVLKTMHIVRFFSKMLINTCTTACKLTNIIYYYFYKCYKN